MHERREDLIPHVKGGVFSGYEGQREIVEKRGDPAGPPRTVHQRGPIDQHALAWDSHTSECLAELALGGQGCPAKPGFVGGNAVDSVEIAAESLHRQPVLGGRYPHPPGMWVVGLPCRLALVSISWPLAFFSCPH